MRQRVLALTWPPHARVEKATGRLVAIKIIYLEQMCVKQTAGQGCRRRAQCGRHAAAPPPALPAPPPHPRAPTLLAPNPSPAPFLPTRAGKRTWTTSTRCGQLLGVLGRGQTCLTASAGTHPTSLDPTRKTPSVLAVPTSTAAQLVGPLQLCTWLRRTLPRSCSVELF